MKIALIHDWFTSVAGGEKVVRAILDVFPQADVFTLFSTLSPKAQKEVMDDRKPTESWLRHLPLLKRYYRNLLPIFPSAVEGLNVSAYDLILSSSSAVAKGVKKYPGQLHICYCHTPMRYAWDLREQYLSGANLKTWKLHLTQRQLDKVQRWDYHSSKNVDVFVANSRHVAERIEKAYGRKARVIYPPVVTRNFTPSAKQGDYFLATGRHVEHKKLHLIAEAFRLLPGQKLIITGEGPETRKLRKNAPPNVTFTGWVDQDGLQRLTQGAKAWIGAAFEDFGISCVEAQSCGVPVIAFKAGGFLESVAEGMTGLFFEEQSPAAVANAINTFLKDHAWVDPAAIRNHALQFDEQAFKREFGTLVKQHWQAHLEDNGKS